MLISSLWTAPASVPRFRAGSADASRRPSARDLAGVEDPVESVLPPSVRWHPAPGVAVRAAALAGDVVTDGDLRWTSRTRTALDLIRRGPLDDAVILLDRPVHADVVELGTVRAAAAALPRCRGSRQAREAALADGLWHGEPQQVGPDRERLNRLLAAALTA